MTADFLDDGKLLEKIAQIRGRLAELHERCGGTSSPLTQLDALERLASESMEEVSEGSLVLDPGMRIMSMDEAAERLFCRKASEVKGRRLIEAFPQAGLDFLAAQLRHALADGKPSSFVTALGSSPTPVWYEVRTIPCDAGMQIHFCEIMEDMPSDLPSSPVLHDIARSTVRACSSVVGAGRGHVVFFATNPRDREVQVVDPSFLPMPGAPESADSMMSLWSRAVQDRRTDSAETPWQGVERRGHVHTLCVPLLVGSEVRGILTLEGKPVGFSPDDQRITREFAARISEAMKALDRAPARESGLWAAEEASEGSAVPGRDSALRATEDDLAGSMAQTLSHDLRVILGGAVSRVERLRADTALPAHLRTEISAMYGDSSRAVGIAAQLEALNRKRPGTTRLVDLNVLLGGMQPRLARQVADQVRMGVSFDPEAGLVLADPAQLEQVLLELAAASREALAHGGELRCAISRVRAGEPPLLLHPEAARSDHAALTVRCTGQLITKAALGRLHEPFFSAAAHTARTGLGLVTVHGIVKQLGGFIEEEVSAPGQTVVRIFLPVAACPMRCRKSASPEPSNSTKAGTAEGSPGPEVILLVEADDAQRTRQETVLRRCGYTVISAPSTRTASSFIPAGLRVRAAVLPLEDGGEPAAQFRTLFPSTGLLFVGRAEDAAQPLRDLPSADSPVLRQPFSLREFALKVWEIAAGKALEGARPS